MKTTKKSTSKKKCVCKAADAYKAARKEWKTPTEAAAEAIAAQRVKAKKRKSK